MEDEIDWLNADQNGSRESKGKLMIKNNSEGSNKKEPLTKIPENHGYGGLWESWSIPDGASNIKGLV